MPCSGNTLFTRVGSAYVGTTPGGTLLVVSCSSPGGVTGWRLTATFGSTSNTYAADASSTCSPMYLVFNSVLIDCGPVNISLSDKIGPCLPSSSSSIAPSSSVSAGDSSSSAASGGSAPSGGMTPSGPDCDNATPINLNVLYSASPPDNPGIAWFQLPLLSVGDYCLTGQWLNPQSGQPLPFRIYRGPCSGLAQIAGIDPADTGVYCVTFTADGASDYFVLIMPQLGEVSCSVKFKVTAGTCPGTCTF